LTTECGKSSLSGKIFPELRYRYVIAKAGICLIESYNSVVRYFWQSFQERQSVTAKLEDVVVLHHWISLAVNGGLIVFFIIFSLTGIIF
jgi:hypothetical protein